MARLSLFGKTIYAKALNNSVALRGFFVYTGDSYMAAQGRDVLWCTRMEESVVRLPCPIQNTEPLRE